MSADEPDAVVFVADTVENASDALKAVTERAKEALRGVPEETRAAYPDGTTRYMRPRPGAARMYPETDVPPIQVSEDYLKLLQSRLPELPAQKMARLIKEYGLNQKLAKQVLDSEHAQLFETVVKQTKVSPTVIAAALTETFKSLRRGGVETENVSDEQILELFRFIDAGKTVKEAIPDIISWLAKHERTSVKEAQENLGLEMLTETELESTIENILQENKSLVEKSGREAFGALMGLTMKKVRGRADAELVAKVLRKKLE
jgi:glutamyl-tRNA(Gln) amidotransferase subunit E